MLSEVRIDIWDFCYGFAYPTTKSGGWGWEEFQQLSLAGSGCHIPSGYYKLYQFYRQAIAITSLYRLTCISEQLLKKNPKKNQGADEHLWSQVRVPFFRILGKYANQSLVSILTQYLRGPTFDPNCDH